MPPSKHPRVAAPQISVSNWILGGSLVTNPRSSRPRPVLVTTEPAKEIKAAEAAKINGEKNGNGKKEDQKAEEDSSKKVEETKATDASKDNILEKLDSDWNWTPEQDALILRLKAENFSWREIAVRMSLAKSDVQVRFKELQKKGAEIPIAKTTDDSKDKDGEKSNDKDSEESTEMNGEGEQKVDSGGGGAREEGGRLKADDNWTREDCEILEMLEARYREQKWLSMQASFYNLTGRMVRADIIERKLSEARS